MFPILNLHREIWKPFLIKRLGKNPKCHHGQSSSLKITPALPLYGCSISAAVKCHISIPFFFFWILALQIGVPIPNLSIWVYTNYSVLGCIPQHVGKIDYNDRGPKRSGAKEASWHWWFWSSNKGRLSCRLGRSKSPFLYFWAKCVSD